MLVCPQCKVAVEVDTNVGGSVLCCRCPECMVTRLMHDRALLQLVALQDPTKDRGRA